MSSESKSDSPIPPELQYMHTFPLSEKVIRNSLDWFTFVISRSRSSLELEKNRQQKNDPALFSFLTDMQNLREEIHLSDEQSDQYLKGAVFGVMLLENQYQHLGLMLPPVNEKTIAAYFKTLITDRDAKNNNDMQYNVLIAAQPTMHKGPITPNALLKQFQTSPSNPLLKDVQLKFKTNSGIAYEQMWESEPHLADAVPDMNNVLDDGRRGFYLGVLDAYAPFKMDHVVGPYAEILDTLEF